MRRVLHLLIPLFLGATGCPKNGDQASPKPQSDKPKAMPEGVEPIGGMRLPEDQVVATWDGGKMTYGELYEQRKSQFKQIRFKYLQDLYQTEQRELEAHIIEQLVKKAAKAKGKSEDEYLKEIAAGASVTEDDILQFYEQRVKQTGQPLEAAKPRIAAYLMQTKQQEAIRKEFSRLAEEANVDMRIPPPKGAVAEFDLAGQPVKGPKDAKVTIVEFSDFQCPYCDRARLEITKVVDAYPNDVAFYFLNFPLSMHSHAKPAAIAAECAHRQGKFWEMHDKLFDNQQNLSDDLIGKLGEDLGLDTAKYEACRKDPAVEEIVEKDMQQGEEAGVEGTPAFFINGVHFSKGVPSADDVRAILEKS